jgi:hypothetical protein
VQPIDAHPHPKGRMRIYGHQIPHEASSTRGRWPSAVREGVMAAASNDGAAATTRPVANCRPLRPCLGGGPRSPRDSVRKIEESYECAEARLVLSALIAEEGGT